MRYCLSALSLFGRYVNFSRFGDFMSEQPTVFNVNELDECDTDGGPWYEYFLERVYYDRDNEHRAVCVLGGGAGYSCANDASHE